MTTDTLANRVDAVVVVIDEQCRLADVMERRDEVVAATVKLLRAAALIGVPVVVTRQYPKGLGETDATVEAALSAIEASGHIVVRVDKTSFDCFGDEGFLRALADLERQQLVIAGMETHICVTQTAVSALRMGFDAHVVADACCSRGAGNHELALDRLRAAGAVVTATESVLYELVSVAGTDEFRALLGIVKG